MLFKVSVFSNCLSNQPTLITCQLSTALCFDHMHCNVSLAKPLCVLCPLEKCIFDQMFFCLSLSGIWILSLSSPKLFPSSVFLPRRSFWLKIRLWEESLTPQPQITRGHIFFADSCRHWGIISPEYSPDIAVLWHLCTFPSLEHVLVDERSNISRDSSAIPSSNGIAVAQLHINGRHHQLTQSFKIWWKSPIETRQYHWWTSVSGESF